MTDGTTESTECCVGCGVLVPRIDGPIHRYLTSAPGCWAMYGELNAMLLSERGAPGFRQLCVDAYALQHPGSPNPQAINSVAVHLLSLHAQLELGLAVRAVHALLNRPAPMKRQFRWLSPPLFNGTRTVGYILEHIDRIDEAAREWAGDVWRAWAPHHAQVREWHTILAGLRQPASSPHS